MGMPDDDDSLDDGMNDDRQTDAVTGTGGEGPGEGGEEPDGSPTDPAPGRVSTPSHERGRAVTGRARRVAGRAQRATRNGARAGTAAARAGVRAARAELATDRRTVRAARRGRRAGMASESAGAGQRDPELLGLVATPFDSVTDARERLTALERLLREREDGRARFLTVYARVTEAVDRRIDAGAFEDPDWVGAYLVTFAEQYRAALVAYERGDLERVPRPWQLSFDAAVGSETLVLQDVLLGVNAHVNYDLALTLDAVGVHPRAARRRDHRAINGTLAALVDVQQDRLADRYAAGVADIDAAFGRLDEAFAALTLREGRRNAWRAAVLLDAGRRVPGLRRGVRWLLATTATGAARGILAPGHSPALLTALREVEDGTDG